MPTCPDCHGKGETPTTDGDMEECVFCGGVGTVDIPEGDGWEDAVQRGVDAHRERFLD